MYSSACARFHIYLVIVQDIQDMLRKVWYIGISSHIFVKQLTFLDVYVVYSNNPVIRLYLLILFIVLFFVEYVRFVPYMKKTFASTIR